MKLSAGDLPMFFAEHHATLAAELPGVASEVADAEASAKSEVDAAEAVARVMGQRGLYEHLVAEPVDVRALCLVREALGYASPLADAIYAVQGLGAHPLLLGGNDAQRSIAAELGRGDRVCGFALTEPDAGSDVASMTTRARRDGEHWVLDGEKTFISNVGLASHFTVFASTEPEARGRGLSAFWVPANAEGLRTEPIELGAPHPLGTLHFSRCRLSDDALIGKTGDGFSLAMRTLDRFRVTVGAAAVGMARRAFDEARGHVRARQQFGKPLAGYQLVQGHLADMLCELDAARLLVLRAAWIADQGQSVTTAAAEAKLYATEAAQRIIDRAVQLFGGRGVCRGEVVEMLYRAVRPLRIYEGTSEIQRIIIGRALGKDED